MGGPIVRFINALRTMVDAHIEYEWHVDSPSDLGLSALGASDWRVY